jgi:superfamily II DNA/RNA helicase
MRALAKYYDFVIGTPGRILDLAAQKKLPLDKFANIVLDEVDQMLDMGFIGDIRKIIAGLSVKRQSLFFSATMPRAVEEIANQFLTSPIKINVRVKETTDNINQTVIKLAGRGKNEVLLEFLATNDCAKTLIFSRTKHGANRIAKILDEQGIKAAAIHGNKAQNYRLKMLDMFRSGKIQILVATDMASRGLDIERVTHVINFDLPSSYEDYIHRIGRTGRAEKTGMAVTLVD